MGVIVSALRRNSIESLEMKIYSTFATTLAVLVINQSVIAQESPEDSKSIQQLIIEADQLATQPDQSYAAIKKYQEAINLHRANDKRFNQAIKSLLRELEKEQRQEEGVELLYDLFEGEAIKARYQLITQTLRKYENKYPDLLEKIQKKFVSKSKKQSPQPQVTPEASLLESILQRSDQQLRDESLIELKSLLAANASEDSKISGLSTLAKALTAKFDHASFYPLVAPLLDSENESIRLLALSCLPRVGGSHDDFPQIASMADDESIHVRKQVGGSIVSIGKGKHSELVIPVLMQLMEDEEHDVVKSTIRSMWGQYSSEEYDHFLVDLSYDPKYEDIVIYHCLSTMQSKSKTVCTRLVEVLADPNWNNSGRAAWGLTYGVTPEAGSLVEEGLLKAIPEETNVYTRKQAFTALRGVATEKSREYVESVFSSDLETAQFKELAQAVLEMLN